MPRQRIDHSTEHHDLPEDFPERLERFKEASGLSWAELNRRLETYRSTVQRWDEGRTRPNHQHRKVAVGENRLPLPCGPTPLSVGPIASPGPRGGINPEPPRSAKWATPL